MTTLVHLVTAEKIKYSFQFLTYTAHIPNDKLELVTCLHNRSWTTDTLPTLPGNTHVIDLFCHLTGRHHYGPVDDVFKELEGKFELMDPTTTPLSGIVVLCEGDYDWGK